ncbi:MAG: enoyl-CoA hydratase/isomerase family protein [Chloroflexota bacterium]|nr:MAG: enoyl-CoA hydratase/isomerase family protein [Chloroflexota bacterium]
MQAVPWWGESHRELAEVQEEDLFQDFEEDTMAGATEYETILVTKQDRVGTITLNRPDKLNACNLVMWSDISRALTDLENDESVRVIVLTGNGRAFSAGEDVDILEFDKGIVTAIKFSEMIFGVFSQFEKIPKIIIAAVNGYAFGFGISVTLFCDIVLASEKAKFGWKEIDHGLMPPETLLTGAEILGKRDIAYLTLTGETFDAHEAKAIGLINKVLPHDQLMTEAYRIADILKKGAPLSQAAIKRTLNRRSKENNDYALSMIPTILATSDAAEGRRAFLEKRPPVYEGK